ncbi:MAG: acetate--CoA ligase family protein [Bacteroidales bacterium]|nr:acetate--CoA ligase family protein [Bacteroidales bacterium]
MINEQLLKPRSIVVVGGSNDRHKPGGAVLQHLIETGYRGDLYVLNPKEDRVQGIQSFKDPASLPEVDLAIIVIPAKFVVDVVEILARGKNTRAFIVISAGFSEESKEGRIMEERLVEIVNSVNGSLIGPNCIGVLSPNYAGVFTRPIPTLHPRGFDFISGSGATACFIMEAGIPIGMKFARVFSVGNSAQIGVEDILQYMDETFDPASSSLTKLLYLETITKPGMLLKHASSLIRKGCQIAAIKAGTSEAGTRAASSHTGALASPDAAVEALFRKAGIVRCHGRDELINVASVFQFPVLKGKNIAIITHAGGPAVMLTDALSARGMGVPHLEGPTAAALHKHLFQGSSVANPIDFLATGNAEQLGIIIDYVEKEFDEIDGMVVIFGTPGLTRVFNEYGVIDEKMKVCKKPIFPILPSIMTAGEEIKDFISWGHTYFPQEVLFATALARVYFTPPPASLEPDLPPVDEQTIRRIIDQSTEGYISPAEIQGLLDACRIPRAREAVVTTPEAVKTAAVDLGFPLVMKVVGPVHKSDVGGVVLNVQDEEILVREFNRMIRIPETTGILLQPMLSGIELFIGASYEPGFGHLILCGLGGIFIEVLKDTSAGLSPLGMEEALSMIHRLKGYQIIQGIRGRKGVNEEVFADIIVKLSALLKVAPEITELDFNPLLGEGDRVVVVDARIRIERKEVGR